MSHPSVEQPFRLLTEERRREIGRLLEEQGRVTVSEIRTLFGVSAVTARSDLDALEASGLLIRSHGGGIKPIVRPPEFPLNARERINVHEKRCIAQAALSLIKPRQTVMIGTGSTCAELADVLRRSSLEHVTVITYALNVALRLADASNISLVLVGGIFRQVSNALVGPQAEQMIAGLTADHCFLPTVGIDPCVGLTTLDILEAQLNVRMMAASRTVTVLADSSKFGERSLAVTAPLDKIHRLITDSKAPVQDIEMLRGLGVEVIVIG